MPKKYKINKKGAWAKQKSLDVTTSTKKFKKIKLKFCSFFSSNSKSETESKNKMDAGGGVVGNGQSGQQQQRRVRGATERVNHLENRRRSKLNMKLGRSLICHKCVPNLKMPKQG